jgi:sugar lactone lactonase YvrE
VKPLLTLMAVVVLNGFGVAAGDQRTTTGGPAGKPELQIVAALTEGPGNITVTPAGEVILSLHQFFAHEIRVARLKHDGRVAAYAENANADSILGLQADPEGVVWMLDNAMRGGGQRRLIGWDSGEDRMIADINLDAVTTAQSFLNDLAIDAATRTAYVADPAGGDDAAIIVVDLADHSARRVLQGHTSVVPEDIDLIIDGTPVRIRTETGSVIRPRVGINPIALDSAGDWLYFGPMHGTSLYRVATRALRDTELPAATLARRVQRWSDKPISDGISIDDEGNIYLGDLASNAIGVITADRQYRRLIADARLSWVDAFSFGPDGYLYAVANQLHRSAVLNAGENVRQPPYLVLRFVPLAEGTSGR